MLAALRLFFIAHAWGELRPHLLLAEQFIDQHICSDSRSSGPRCNFNLPPEVGPALLAPTVADRPTSSSDVRFTSKANIEATQTDVRYWHLADIPIAPVNVRFWGKADLINSRCHVCSPAFFLLQ